MAQQSASVPLNDATVVDAKPLHTLTPMFPAPLGLHTFTPQNSPSFICVTPFGPYAGGTDLGISASVPPMFAAPVAPAEPSQRQLHTGMNGVFHANGTADNSMVTPTLQTPPAATEEAGKRKRGRPKRVQDTTVHSVASISQAPLNPPVPSVAPISSLPLVPSGQEGNNIVSQIHSSVSTQDLAREKGDGPS